MSHIPVNHHLRPLYRVLSALAAIYLVIFGVVGVAQSSGGEFFGRDEVTALGEGTNMAFSLLSILTGAVVLLAIFVGRNLDRFVMLWGGVAIMVLGLAMLALLHTDLNVLNFSLATVMVSFAIGLLFFSAGLYVRSGSVALAEAEEALRHGAN